MISVALCTYNGERYIREQILSILDQAMRVDEIVICDDGSKDNTLTEIKEIAITTDVQIRVFLNEESLGVKGNFKKAIELCNGDYVFLSDQDDYWLPNKVETIMAWFTEHPSKSVVFTDAYLVDENRKCYEGRTQFQGVGFRKLQQEMVLKGHGLEVFMMANRATGATMAFRKASVELRENDWGAMLHDEYIAVKALLKDELGVILEPLIEYRQHNGQQVGSSISDKEIESVYGDWHFFDPAKSLMHIQRWRFVQNDILRAHIEMLQRRDEMRHSVKGLCEEWAAKEDYRKLYGPFWCRYIKADMRKTIGHIWHKFVR